MDLRVETAVSVVILFMLLLASCTIGKTWSVGSATPPPPTRTPVPTVIDTGLAYGIPCEPPCWQGLIPGESTYQEATRILEQLLSSGQINNTYEGTTSTGTTLIHVYLKPFGVVFLDFEDDILKGIEGHVGFDYTVIDLIEQFGTPEGLFLPASKEVPGCRSCKEWIPPDGPGPSWIGHLLYPSQGLWFSISIPWGGEGCICPEMKVSWFYYHPPRSMKETLEDGFLVEVKGYVSESTTEEDLVEWHGFGGDY